MYLAALNQIANRDAAADERGTAGQFALEVMHEIANPLDSLGNLAFLTRNEADQPEKVREYMRLAEEQIANLNRIARQALSFAGSLRRRSLSTWSIWPRPLCGYTSVRSLPNGFTL